MTRYAIILEDAGNNWAAYVPDLPGCVATGKTLEDCKREIADAIRFHLEGMREDGIDIPPPLERGGLRRRLKASYRRVTSSGPIRL